MRYLIAGGTAFATNIILLFILVHFFHVWYLFAAITSFIGGVYVSFMMQKFFTFNDYGKEKIRKQQAIYLGVQVFNLGINTLFMYIGVDLFHLSYLISQILIASVMAVYNFFIYKYLIFCPVEFYKITEKR